MSLDGSAPCAVGHYVLGRDSDRLIMTHNRPVMLLSQTYTHTAAYLKLPRILLQMIPHHVQQWPEKSMT